MKHEEMNKIIDFAIEREREAVSFYRDLQKNNNFSGKKELLKELENMELSHIDQLNKLKTKDIKDLNYKKIEDLKISDYLVDTPDREDLTYQDILIIAMKKEESAYKLYAKLSEKFDEGSIGNKLFLSLASEEVSHKKQFEEIYDNEILREN